MALDPKALIPAGALLLALAFGSKKASAKSRTPSGPCKGLGPITTELVEAAATPQWDAGVRGGALTSAVAQTMFPAGPWPLQDPWVVPADAPEKWACAWAEITRILVELGLGDPGTDGPSPGKVLGELIKTNPTPGHFYKIKTGSTAQQRDNLSKIARRALNSVVSGAGDSAQNRLQYIYCMTSSPAWNLPLYGAKYTSSQVPALYSVNGYTLARAFMPWHEDAITEVQNGRMPTSMVEEDGSRISGGSTLGLLWLPPVSEEDLRNGVVTCGPFNWDDGTSSINPPPQLLNLLEEPMQ